jgi:general secretion pathway protein N
VVLGAALAATAWAPARWLAQAVQQASAERLVLADAQGSLWRGNAVAVLTGGAGSRDAAALPGRLHWRVGLDGIRPVLRLRHEGFIHGEVTLRPAAAPGGLRLAVIPQSGAPAGPRAIGQWPAAWLAGLGTPWNTLRLQGMLRLSADAPALRLGGGSVVMEGLWQLDLDRLATGLSTLPALGDYRLTVRGDAAAPAAVALATREGALRLTAQGQWDGRRLLLRGEAVAAPGSQAVLDNLLNLIGRRQGAAAIISIGTA